MDILKNLCDVRIQFISIGDIKTDSELNYESVVREYSEKFHSINYSIKVHAKKERIDIEDVSNPRSWYDLSDHPESD